jgi:hypothetical protein
MADPSTQARLLLQSVDEVWQRHHAALDEACADAIHGLEELMHVDDYHHHAHDRDQLERSLGPMGVSNLDLGSLSHMLGESTHSRAMPPDRLARVQGLIPELGQMKRELPVTLADSPSIDMGRDLDEILTLAEDHLNRAARVFRTLRTAQMEVRSKYESETYDALFADFTWRQLGPSELGLCPPFFVVANLEGDGGAPLRKMMSLLESGLPIKILALRSSLREVYSAVAGTSVPAMLSMEMLASAMRGVHFAQTCPCIPEFQSQFFKAIVAPRAAVISLLSARKGEERAAFERRAEGAMRSRAFPMCIYDPDLTTSFVDCFDLSSNPSPDQVWIGETLRGPDLLGHPVEVEEAFTFAHFAVSDPEFEDEFSDPPENTDNLVSMVEYLELSRHQRPGKLPFVWCVGEEGSVVRKVVSQAVALQCAERRHLWCTLRAIAGIDNPHVRAARAELRQELSAQQEKSVQKLRTEMEEQMARREKAVVANAVRNLVTKLTGVETRSEGDP